MLQEGEYGGNTEILDFMKFIMLIYKYLIL